MAQGAKPSTRMAQSEGTAAPLTEGSTSVRLSGGNCILLNQELSARARMGYCARYHPEDQSFNLRSSQLRGKRSDEPVIYLLRFLL